MWPSGELWLTNIFRNKTRETFITHRKYSNHWSKKKNCLWRSFVTWNSYWQIGNGNPLNDLFCLEKKIKVNESRSKERGRKHRSDASFPIFAFAAVFSSFSWSTHGFASPKCKLQSANILPLLFSSFLFSYDVGNFLCILEQGYGFEFIRSESAWLVLGLHIFLLWSILEQGGGIDVLW
jgi:hypothetical protein